MNNLRRRLLQMALPMLAILLLVYTAYQLLNGEKGIYTWKLVGQQVATLHTEIDTLKTQVTSLNRQVSRLKKPVDNDYMDELVRRNLPMGKTGEVVILTSPSGYAGRITPTEPDEPRSEW